MKTPRLFTLAVCLLLFGNTCKAQWVSIPDTNFANYLRTNWGFASCVMGDNTNGWQMDTTCPAVNSIKWLQCNGMNIRNIHGIQYFDSLVRLDCYDNEIDYLPYLPPRLEHLDCSNQVSSNFGFSFHVPPLPNTLTNLYCSNNQINLLQALPAGLIALECENNWLTFLPSLPANLQRLVCSNNQLSVLPALPPGLTWLNCAGTNISALPQLPDSLFSLNIDNTTITCMPPIKTIVNFIFTNTNISCLSNYPYNNGVSYPSLSTVPLCDYFNSNGCPAYWNISGKTYTDANFNCQADAVETGISNTPIQLWSNGNLVKQFSGVENGNYSFHVTNFGSYQITVDTTNIPFTITCPAGGSLTSTISVADSVDYDMDISLECKPGFDLEARCVSGHPFRAANITYIDVNAGEATDFFYNAHCATGVNGNVILSFTGPVSYIAPDSAALTPTVTGNTLTWNIADFGSVNFFEDFDVVMQTDTFAQIGQQVCFTLTVNPILGDNNPANNVLTICFPVVNSYDPNDKQVYPDGNIDTAQKELTYTIRFQNTGNAEAQHIYITDTLDANVRPETFELLAYSHQPMVQLDGNNLRFNFPNINLPDSTTNEPASHGYVQFKVRLKDNLPVGTVINNTAHIYFDFNAPVVTNTTTNTIYVPKPPVPVSISKHRIQRAVMPNGRL